MYTLLALTPAISTALALLTVLPLLLWRMHTAATAPQDSLPDDGWAQWLLSDLDAPTLETVDAGWPTVSRSHQRQPRRMARAVQRSRMHAAAWRLQHTPAPIESCPPTKRTPYAPSVPLH